MAPTSSSAIGMAFRRPTRSRVWSATTDSKAASTTTGSTAAPATTFCSAALATTACFVRGEIGRDFLAGGLGADAFFFGDVGFGPVEYESGVGKGNRDRVTDFSRAEGDKIDVSEMDADLTATGLQAFSFVGGDAVGTGELGFFESAGSTIVRGNTDADAAVEFEIQLDGAGLDLVGDDFVL